jgi:glyoxalase family protein
VIVARHRARIVAPRRESSRRAANRRAAPPIAGSLIACAISCYAVAMQLEGIHHISCITGDAAANVDFYVGVMGLRLAKKTVNQDDPTVYHLFYGDEHGSPGHDLTFFEYPGARPGRAGMGMIHRLVHRVGSDASLDFWADRLAANGVATERGEHSLRFADPEGLGHELIVDESGDEPLIATSDVPPEHALRGFAGVRAYGDPARTTPAVEGVLGFESRGEGSWEVRGSRRGGTYDIDPPPAEYGIPGAGTVHHVAFAMEMADEDAWRSRVLGSGLRPTPIIDRFYFHSVYFREPGGVLFELATMGPGFTVDQPESELGSTLALPPFLEARREQIEAVLTPLPDPRGTRA